MQRPKRIKIEINNTIVEVFDGKFKITEGDVVLEGELSDLNNPQNVWVDNIFACSESLVSSLNLIGLTGGI